MERKIEKFHLIRTLDVKDLDKEVNKHIEKGWELYGNLIYTGSIYCMSVVKYTKENKKLF